MDRERLKQLERENQYLSIRYIERLKQVNIAASVGSTGDSYDNAMAETINGLFKTRSVTNKFAIGQRYPTAC